MRLRASGRTSCTWCSRNSIRTRCVAGTGSTGWCTSHTWCWSPGSAVTRQAPTILQEVQEHDQGIDRQQDQPIVGGRHHLYRHRWGVAYLHLLTDAFTHEIIGWVLSDSLVASNTVTALDMGISHVSPLGSMDWSTTPTAAFNIVVINILIVYRPLKPRSAWRRTTSLPTTRSPSGSTASSSRNGSTGWNAPRTWWSQGICWRGS